MKYSVRFAAERHLSRLDITLTWDLSFTTSCTNPVLGGVRECFLLYVVGAVVVL